ncbi:MAG: fasciclin domain-containing protein [Planctomycetaceae bacterium]|nr:fasciclin domain-containing protein [Planctomycetaceae bacterium]
MLIRRLTLGLVAVALMAGADAVIAGEAKSTSKDIVTTAVESGSFKTLAAALTAADLVETLQGPGPFTVFAPTDEAFAKLPAGTVADLLKPENKSKLSAVLTYHVVAGNVMAADVVKLNAAATVNGQRVDVHAGSDSVMIDQARVVKTDIACSNGVIHVIDQVLLPSEARIPAVAASAGSFKTLLAAAEAAGLVDALSGDAPLTVFAPTDEAFAKLPRGTVESLLKPENKHQLVEILKLHVVSGRNFSTDLLAAKSAKSLQGGELHVSVTQGEATVEGAKLLKTDIDAANGVIHVIDAVLLPKSSGKKAGQASVSPKSQPASYVCPQSGRVVLLHSR